ncbi:MAG: hypothetical protein CMI16_05420 [Opitutaceae bacterium]|nr:hypothetical protein [Opitutaceae bacterium]
MQAISREGQAASGGVKPLMDADEPHQWMRHDLGDPSKLSLRRSPAVEGRLWQSTTFRMATRDRGLPRRVAPRNDNCFTKPYP